MIRCLDWRDAPAALVARLYDGEIGRWGSRLHWDTRPLWPRVETARRAGSLPGFIAVDGRGAIVGWTFFLVRGDSLQIGGLVAASGGVTECLLDAILESDDASAASDAMLFAFGGAPGLDEQLERHRFTAEPYHYLERPLGGTPPSPRLGRPWDARDVRAAARLLARTYTDVDPARPFARQGRYVDWLDYTEQLVMTDGCGAFVPQASLVVPAREPARLDAAVLVTAVGPETAHVAQVAVDPAAQGRGIGRGLLTEACRMLEDSGFERLTLLVADHNRAANALYAKLGFRETAAFVAAGRFQPRRFNSAALETGGARTFL